MLKNLPKPTTFEQGERLKFGWLMVASGMFVGIVALALVVFFAWLSFKFPANRELILYILAGGFAAYLAMQSSVMFALAIGGPVGRGKASATKDGVSLEMIGDDEPPSASVTMSAQIETTQ